MIHNSRFDKSDSINVRVVNCIAECAGDLTLLESTKLIVSSSKYPTFINGSTVNSRYAWCATTAATTEYIIVDLGSIRQITGFGIQGDSENDQWPKNIEIGASNSSNLPFKWTKVILLFEKAFFFCPI